MVRGMSNYFTVSTDSPRARAFRDLVRATLGFWRGLQLREEQDRDLEIRSVSADTGLSRGVIVTNLNAVARLSTLPTLDAHNNEHNLLDLPRLVAIDLALVGIAENLIPEVDQRLTEFLTPTRPNQVLPSPEKIKRHIHNIVAMLDPEITPTPPPELSDSVNVRHHPDGSANLSLQMTGEQAHEIQSVVAKHAEKTGSTHAEALLGLVHGDTPPTVVLNLYRAKDIENAPVFCHPIGWLDDDTAETLLKRVTKVRDLDEIKQEHNPAYSASESQRVYLNGRDGTCRWPGCTVNALHTQKDHRINHADGGPTHVDNLACLCAHHHNIKTDTRAFYVLDPHSGEAAFLFSDGTWAWSSAEGPLGRGAKHWVQTFAQHRTAREKRARDAKRDKSTPNF